MDLLDLFRSLAWSVFIVLEVLFWSLEGGSKNNVGAAEGVEATRPFEWGSKTNKAAAVFLSRMW